MRRSISKNCCIKFVWKSVVPESLEVAFDGAIVVVVCALSFAAVNRKQNEMINRRFVMLQKNRYLRVSFADVKQILAKLIKRFRLEEIATLYYHLMLHVTYFQFSISVVNGTVPDIYFGMQPATQTNSAFHPFGVGKWGPALEKAGMVHSVSGWTRDVQVKLWDPLRRRAIPERLRGAITTRRYTNPCLPYLTLDNIEKMWWQHRHVGATTRSQRKTGISGKRIWNKKSKRRTSGETEGRLRREYRTSNLDGEKWSVT